MGPTEMVIVTGAGGPKEVELLPCRGPNRPRCATDEELLAAGWRQIHGIWTQRVSANLRAPAPKKLDELAVAPEAPSTAF